MKKNKVFNILLGSLLTSAILIPTTFFTVSCDSNTDNNYPYIEIDETSEVIANAIDADEKPLCQKVGQLHIENTNKDQEWGFVTTDEDFEILEGNQLWWNPTEISKTCETREVLVKATCGNGVEIEKAIEVQLNTVTPVISDKKEIVWDVAKPCVGIISIMEEEVIEDEWVFTMRNETYFTISNGNQLNYKGTAGEHSKGIVGAIIATNKDGVMVESLFDYVF